MAVALTIVITTTVHITDRRNHRRNIGQQPRMARAVSMHLMQDADNLCAAQAKTQQISQVGGAWLRQQLGTVPLRRPRSCALCVLASRVLTYRPLPSFLTPSPPTHTPLPRTRHPHPNIYNAMNAIRDERAPHPLPPAPPQPPPLGGSG